MILNWHSNLSALPGLVALWRIGCNVGSWCTISARGGKYGADHSSLRCLGKTSSMKKDWGFSALIEYGGKRILFDTGNNAEIFAHNVAAKGIDLTMLDFAIISHRHGDHTSGLNH